MNAFAIKIIALITMIIDHIGYLGGLTWFDKPNFTIFRIIGNISFPLFIFLIAEGCRYSKDLKKYMKRLLTFALISEIPYLLFSKGFFTKPFVLSILDVSIVDFKHPNVLFTLFLGVFTVYLYEKIKLTKLYFLSYGAILFTAPLAQILHTEYGAKGVITIFLMYLAKTKPMQILVIALFFIYTISYSIFTPIFINIFVRNSSSFIIPSLLILLYNNKRGSSLQYLFYWAYPAHLIIIALIWYMFFL